MVTPNEFPDYFVCCQQAEGSSRYRDAIVASFFFSAETQLIVTEESEQSCQTGRKMFFQIQLSFQKVLFIFCPPLFPILHAVQVVILKSSTSTSFLTAMPSEEMEENSHEVYCLTTK